MKKYSKNHLQQSLETIIKVTGLTKEEILYNNIKNKCMYFIKAHTLIFLLKKTINSIVY